MWTCKSYSAESRITFRGRELFWNNTFLFWNKKFLFWNKNKITFLAEGGRITFRRIRNSYSGIRISYSENKNFRIRIRS